MVENRPLCREHFLLVLALEQFPPTRPGQFVQISCRDLDIDYSPQRESDWQPGQLLDVEGQELMSPLAMLRRPFSLAGRRDQPAGVELEIIHRVVGVGTEWMAKLAVGDSVHILGPLGNSFDLPVGESAGTLVGGGVGIPPMLYLAGALEGRKAVVFAGALSRDLLPFTIAENEEAPGHDSVKPLGNVLEFARHGVGAVISTDDGSYGFRGYVTQALEKYLDEMQRWGGPAPTIYTCGPELMMKRVADIAAQRGLECQIAVERAMACGMGTCQSCCIRVKKPDPRRPPLVGKDWCYRLACTDGPVFRGAELLW